MLFPFFSIDEIGVVNKFLSWPLNYQNEWMLRLIFLILGLIVLGLIYRSCGRLTALVLLVSPVFIYLFSALNILLVFTQKDNGRLFSDMGLVNGINIFRGQGTDMGVSPLLARLLLNKSYFLLVGILHWLTGIGPAKLFGQFDGEGIWGPSSMGMFPKIFIIPMLVGLVKGIKIKRIYLSLLIALVLTFPVVFLYPQPGFKFLVLALPFWAIIISVGLKLLSSTFKFLVLLLAVIEILATLLFSTYESKVTNFSRPSWVKEVVFEAKKNLFSKKVYMSDNVVGGLPQYLYWYKAENIKLISLSNDIFRCTAQESAVVYLSQRDLDIIKQNIPDMKTIKTFVDNRRREMVFQMEPKICVK